MTDVPEALVERVAQALIEHPSIPANLNETMFYCPTCGADDDQIAGPNSPTHATHQARAVLAAVWPDLAEERRRAIDSALIFAAAHDEDAARPVVDRDALAEHCLVTPVQCGCGKRLSAGWSVNREEWADHVLASGVVQDAADVRRAVAVEIVADLDECGYYPAATRIRFRLVHGTNGELGPAAPTAREAGERDA